jgi:hypothetical protein
MGLQHYATLLLHLPLVDLHLEFESGEILVDFTFSAFAFLMDSSQRRPQELPRGSHTTKLSYSNHLVDLIASTPNFQSYFFRRLVPATFISPGSP